MRARNTSSRLQVDLEIFFENVNFCDGRKMILCGIARVKFLSRLSRFDDTFAISDRGSFNLKFKT